jgi:hypothetical protein
VERKKNDQFSDWTPPPRLLAIIFRWAGRPKYHFFNDIWNSTEVCACELGYTTFEYLRLRCWLLTRRGKDSNQQEHIEYRRLNSCLVLQFGRKKGSKAKKVEMIAKFHSMISALYHYLDIRVAATEADVPFQYSSGSHSFFVRSTLLTSIESDFLKLANTIVSREEIQAW